MGRRLAILVFLCLTLLLGFFFPDVWERAVSRNDSLPPGIQAPQKQLLRIWIMDDKVSSTPWLKRQATAFEKEQSGVSVYIRTALAQELTKEDTVLPDLIFFSPGLIKAPENVFLPITGQFPISDGALRSGRWQGMQYALPVCLDGYALAYDPALTGSTAATPAPTPLLGIGAAPSSTPEPQKGSTFQEFRTSLTSIPKGKNVTTDIQCSPGMPLLLFSVMSGGKEDLPASILHTGFGSAPKETALSEFASGRSRSAMLTAVQLRSLLRQGRAFSIFASPIPASDLYLAAGIVNGSGKDLAMAFVQKLLSDSGQKDLVLSGLMSVNPSIQLYGGDPVFGIVEQSMLGDVLLPNAFSYDAQQIKNVSQSMFTNGGAIINYFESIR